MSRVIIWLTLSLILTTTVLIGAALIIGRGLHAEAQIAYAARLTSDNFNLYLLSVSRRITIPLTRDAKHNNIAPEWSPQGDELAYISDLEGDYRVFVMALANGSIRPLTPFTTSKNRPLWSPDGSKILYVSVQSGYAQLMMMDTRTQITRALSTERDPYITPDWSPDSQQVMFISNRGTAEGMNIYSLDVVSGIIQPYLTTPGHDLSLSWSPDGHYLLYTLDKLPPSIFLWDTITEQFGTLDTPTSPNSVPAWSRDGDFIVYTAFVSGGNMAIFQLDVENCLTANQSCVPEQLSYASGIYAGPQWRPLAP